jgi:hypothetical protein
MTNFLVTTVLLQDIDAATLHMARVLYRTALYGTDSMYSSWLQ